jgi:hypothetical protein
MRKLVLVVLAVMCMAPTAGDIGGCGKTATDLDPDDYAFARKSEDCQRCRQCAITNARCTRACDLTKAPDVELPSTCKPVRHDGEVCLRAIDAVSCEKFATYVDDFAPATPSECDFCRLKPEPPPPAFADGGGDAQ